MKNLVILLVALFIINCELNAQTKSEKKSPVLTEVSDESVGISAERLARIDKMCEEEVANGNLPGIVTLISRNGKIVLWTGKDTEWRITLPVKKWNEMPFFESPRKQKR